MVSLVVVVLDVLSREKAHVVLAERDHTIETFLFDRAHEPFGVHVEIGTPRRQPNGLDPPLIRMSVTTRVYRGSRS